MARLHVYADEAGNFDFSRGSGASRFFILTTVTFFDDRKACRDLDDLRYDLAWEGVEHPGPFHATTDAQATRDRVFARLATHRFRIDSTVLEKAKANPRIRRSDETFYRHAWFYHMRQIARSLGTPADEVLVIAASIGTRRKRSAFARSVHEVVRESRRVPTRFASWPAEVDPGLQVADYCSWAIQRKWEMDDSRSYDLVQDRVASEFDLFGRGSRLFY